MYVKGKPGLRTLVLAWRNDTDLYTGTLGCHPGESSGQAVDGTGASMEGKHGANQLEQCLLWVAAA